LFSKTRLVAFMAVLLVGLVAVVVAGCGGGDSSSSPETTATEEPAEGGTGAAEEEGGEEEPSGGGEKLAVGSDIPYPPFEQGKKGEYTGFDVELMEAIGKEIGREPEFIDSSFETIFRDVAQGKFEAVMSAAKNAKRSSSSRIRTTSPNRRSWSKKAATSKASPTSRGGSSPPSRARPGSNSARKKPKHPNSGPTRKAPTRTTR
jgi:ABC-type amino acid transport substrate-binding protein